MHTRTHTQLCTFRQCRTTVTRYVWVLLEHRSYKRLILIKSPMESTVILCWLHALKEQLALKQVMSDQRDVQYCHGLSPHKHPKLKITTHIILTPFSLNVLGRYGCPSLAPAQNNAICNYCHNLSASHSPKPV